MSLAEFIELEKKLKKHSKFSESTLLALREVLVAQKTLKDASDGAGVAYTTLSRILKIVTEEFQNKKAVKVTFNSSNSGKPMAEFRLDKGMAENAISLIKELIKNG